MRRASSFPPLPAPSLPFAARFSIVLPFAFAVACALAASGGRRGDGGRRRRSGVRRKRSIVPFLATAALLGLSIAAPVRAVDDDLLAHRLYREGRYAEAAELFTDPAWKGVALYRAEQWWRAADAFVRADDARSAHNLGNAYVRLGYHELALEAYRRALALDPTLDDARHNADVIVKLLALGEDGEGGGRSPSEDELERIERDRPDEERGDDRRAGEGGEEEDEDARDESGAGESERGEEERDGGEGASPDESGATDDERQAERGDGAGGALGGTASEPETASRASGDAESGDASERSEAAGTRGEIEGEQATAQWLARIAHDPQRFLERRIALESRRRRAAGHAAPEGGDGW